MKGVVARLQQLDCDWADGHYTFALPIRQLMELQEKCDAGPRWILQLIEIKREKPEWIRETIRLALIGGGTEPTKALKLVENYADPYPLKAVVLAHEILSTWLLGVPDEAPKKADAETTDAPRSLRSQEEKSASETSSEAAAQWGSTSLQ